MKRIVTISLLAFTINSYGQNTYLQVHETQRSINRNTPARIAGTHSVIDTCCIVPIPFLRLKNWAIYGNQEDSLRIFFINGKSCWMRVWTGSTYSWIRPIYPLN